MAEIYVSKDFRDSIIRLSHRDESKRKAIVTKVANQYVAQAVDHFANTYGFIPTIEMIKSHQDGVQRCFYKDFNITN